MQGLARPAARLAWTAPRTLAVDFALHARKGWHPSQVQQTWLHYRTRAFASSPIRLNTAEKPTYDTEKSSNACQDSAAPTEVKDGISELPSTFESRRSDVQQRFSHIMDNLQSRILHATQTLNDVTGYSGIEAIKAENNKLEAELAQAHERLRAARADYKSSNTKRAATQREVTTLLARKDGWTPTDLERFTELYRTDHVLEGEVAAAQARLTEAEAEEQSLGQRLNAGILKRYHEEQIWSDRIRRASTWGTWGLMGMNIVLFLILQFVAEPWKRRRLVRGVVEEEKQVLEEVRAELEAVKSALVKREEVALPIQLTPDAQSPPERLVGGTSPAGVIETQLPPLSWTELLSDPSRWKMFAVDLASERRVELTMREASMLAVEGALAGAAVMGTMALLMTRGR